MAKTKSDSQKVETGKVYKCIHSRKGTFHGRVVSQDDEWVTVEIVQGIASAILSYNVREEGEEVTCRRSLCYFTPPDKGVPA